jgi:F0F1-type ATP synthase assembly protein I
VFSTIFTIAGWWMGGVGGAIVGLLIGIVIDLFAGTSEE